MWPKFELQNNKEKLKRDRKISIIYALSVLLLTALLYLFLYYY